MPQVLYANNGNPARTVRIIADDGFVTDYLLEDQYPEHIPIIIDLDNNADMRANIAEVYIEPVDMGG